MPRMCYLLVSCLAYGCYGSGVQLGADASDFADTVQAEDGETDDVPVADSDERSDSWVDATDCRPPCGPGFECSDGVCVPTTPDGHADVDGGEASDDGGGTMPCIPALGPPVRVLRTSGEPDEVPSSRRSGSDFVFLGKSPGPDTADGLWFQRVARSGALVAPGTWLASSVELGPVHPLVELLDGTLAVAARVTSTPGAGIWLSLVDPDGGGSTPPQWIPGTERAAAGPTLAFDGSDVLVAWSRSGWTDVFILAQRCDRSTGAPIGTEAVVATGSLGAGEPLIGATTGGSIALAYLDGTGGDLAFALYDGDFSYLAGTSFPPPSGDSIAGYSAPVWNGNEFGLAWETVGPTGSSLHLATLRPDDRPVEVGSALADLVLENDESGQLALAWDDRNAEWGVVWQRSVDGRKAISLTRVRAAHPEAPCAPVDVTPGFETGAHPGLSYNDGYYLISWTTVEGPEIPAYVATYGCAP